MRSSFFLVFAILFLWPPIIYAQESLKLGIRGGFNLSNQRIDTEFFNIEDDTEAKSGLQIGVVLYAPFKNSNFGIQPSLMFKGKGYRFDENILLVDVEVTSSPLYLHAPVPIVYNFNIGKTSLFAGAGPYVSYGIGGEIDTTGDVGAIDFFTDSDIEWGNEQFEDTYRPFDWGAVFTVGVRISPAWQVDISYEAGLQNIVPEGDDDTSIKNRSLGCSLVYFFSN
ncbi:PorT family protein [Aquimarina sp. U1-2]|uniref:porin family protein n=1 Tax=Aquimarina sp. U1-2 TaxID=2823141 RepID=UPI001AECE05F|nr:porin family protein [Aquimarina sp. U1-2]MBP2834050.1 PorT family protein [Aquimarina sp. U1-2]